MPWNFVFKFCLATVITKRSFYPIFVVLGKLYDSAKYISRLLGLNQIQLTNSPLFLVKSSCIFSYSGATSIKFSYWRYNQKWLRHIFLVHGCFKGMQVFYFDDIIVFLTFNTVTQNVELTDAVSRSYAVSRLDWIRLRQLFNQKCFWE